MEKPPDCYGCPLANISDGFIRSEGEGTNGVVILGEAGGWNEYIDALPFRPYAQAGSKLDEAIKEAANQLCIPVTRSQFLIYNVVNCHPPGDKLAGMKYEQEAIAHCSRYVDAVVGGFHTNKIKTILALGNIPLKATTGFSGIPKESQSINNLRGYVFKNKHGLVVPSLHPSGIKRGKPGWMPLLVEDIKKALAVASGTYTSYIDHPTYKPPSYQLAPSLDEAWSFYYRCRDSSKLVVSYDIETQDSAAIDEDERDELTSKEITQIQFSLAMREGIAFPWEGEYITVAKAILALPNIKAGHNVWQYDDPILKANGVVINGKIIDTQWLYKHWQPELPRGLQSVASMVGFPFAWKHLAKINLPFYGCADVDSVQYILACLPKLMKARGIWTGFTRHVLQVNTIYTKAGDRGIPVSEARWEQVSKEFKEERKVINTKLQEMIPDEIKNIRPRRKNKETGEEDYGYLREPKLVKEASEIYTSIAPMLVEKGKKVERFDDYVNKKFHKLNKLKDEDDESDLVPVDFQDGDKVVQRWCIIEPFKASNTQLQRYLKYKQGQIEKEITELKKIREVEHSGRYPELTRKINELQELYKDYEVPISLKTKNPTTSKEELEEIFNDTGDEVIDKVISIRSLDTNLNNYLPNWKPHKDSRVHPLYGYKAASGQINSLKPNSQNCSKHTDYGKRFRAVIEAPPGYCFVEADKKSFHIAVMGYNANDRDYIRFSQLDPHSIFGSRIAPDIIGCVIDLGWGDSDILEASGKFKKRCDELEKEPHGINVRQQLAKPTILGNQLGLGAKKLQRQNQRYIDTIEEAARYQRELAELFPKPESYKKHIKQTAFEQRYLINEFGRIQYFYDVFHFQYDKRRRKWNKKDSDGALKPIAFRVQSPAFGMITEELLELDRLGACDEHNFMVTIHDSLIFMPEISKRDKCVELLHDVMSRPCKQLVNEATGPEGLRVAVEISVGQNWRDMEKIKI